jgi:hypothetical protein
VFWALRPWKPLENWHWFWQYCSGSAYGRKCGYGTLSFCTQVVSVEVIVPVDTDDVLLSVVVDAEMVVVDAVVVEVVSEPVVTVSVVSVVVMVDVVFSAQMPHE